MQQALYIVPITWSASVLSCILWDSAGVSARGKTWGRQWRIGVGKDEFFDFVSYSRNIFKNIKKKVENGNLPSTLKGCLLDRGFKDKKSVYAVVWTRKSKKCLHTLHTLPHHFICSSEYNPWNESLAKFHAATFSRYINQYMSEPKILALKYEKKCDGQHRDSENTEASSIAIIKAVP